MSTNQTQICERCGQNIVARQCKLICENCGAQLDCTDLFIDWPQVQTTQKNIAQSSKNR